MVAKHTHDLVIRGGTVIDGSGRERRVADVAVSGGVVTEVGRVSGSGTEEIDARGRIVTPGFVDVHTHYDGQVTWDQRMQPSSWHGVTTVVAGNCGVGFAPCRPQDRDRLVRLMEGVEDIPFPVLTAGLPWNWLSYADYLDSLQSRSFDVDIASQLPHAALRVFVMGERGVRREPATQADIAEMAEIARVAMEAGAIGFSTSRTLNHRDSDGGMIPTLTAAEDELTGIAMGMASAFNNRGAGVLQLISDFTPDPRAEFAMLRRIVERSGRPLSFSLMQVNRAPEDWRILVEEMERAVSDGLPIRAQAGPRAVGILLGLDLTLNPFSLHPTYKEMAHLSRSERVARLKNSEVRRRLLMEEPENSDAFGMDTISMFDRMYPLEAENPDYEPAPDGTISALARATGVDPRAIVLDHMLKNDGRGFLYIPLIGYSDGSLSPSYEMLSRDSIVPGLSDGGAHVGMICDGSFPTSMLTHWTRDRKRGPRLPLEMVIRKQTRDTAALVGLHDRGLISPGYRADLNVIDYDRLTLHAPEAAFDLPAGGRRLLQRASGYAATVVAGHVTYREGKATGALPGRLIRGAKPSPR
jgi:N-acyl-D-aspartate/D-glutamate deacylase